MARKISTRRNNVSPLIHMIKAGEARIEQARKDAEWAARNVWWVDDFAVADEQEAPKDPWAD